MGLAASQARFLAITARKADCESKSMEYAQEKLDISRKMATATANYQNSLNATKLVWDASAAETAITDLSYDVMMTPNPLNGYDPYLLTNQSGRVILSSKLANAIMAAGIDEKGSEPSATGYASFLAALEAKGIITTSLANQIAGAGYVREAGLGAEPLDKTTSNAMTFGTMQGYFDDTKNYLVDFENHIMGTTPYSSDPKNSTISYSLTKNGQLLSSKPDDLTLGDLMYGNYVWTVTNVAQNDYQGVLNNLINKIAGLLGYGQSTYTGLYTDSASKIALENAYQVTASTFVVDDKTPVVGNWKNNDSGRSTAFNKTVSKANEINDVSKGDLKDTDKDTYSVNISNMIDVFLTAYVQELHGYDTGYNIAEKVKDSLYVTEDPSYYYVVHNDNTIATETDLMIADFYNIMYNQICSNGWTTLSGANIEDKEYLSHALKNGQIFISSLNTDGYYYQGAYTENGYVQEVTDDDAIAEAEAEYNKIKTTLNYKEQKIDLKVKNLDLEISALSTEYDTVKQLISKGVEKTFSMFNS